MKLRARFLLLCMTVFLAASVFAGCGNDSEIRFLTPDGGTLLPVAKLFSDAPEIGGKTFSGEIVSGVAIKSRLLAGTCDAAVAPVDLCAEVFESSGAYLFAGVVAWGNNYIISTDGSEPADLTALYGQIVYAFAENAVPGRTLKLTLERKGIEYETIIAPEQATDADRVYLLFMGVASDVRNAFMQDGSIKYAMLPEPNVTAVTREERFKVAFDLQALWDASDPSAGYPQAGLMIKKELAEQDPALVRALLDAVTASAEYCLENPEETARTVEEMQSALPPAAVTSAYISGRGQTVMRFGKISDPAVRASVSSYLEALIGTAPAEGFYYEAA